MTKRVLLITLALFLFIGGAFLIFRILGNRRSPALPSPSPGVDDLLPESPLASSPLPTVEPGPVQTVSLACPEQWSGLPDSDRDGLPDTTEDLYGTDKEKTDSDGDGFTDGEEVRAGFDPRRSVGNPRLDTDGDGLSENDECRWKTDPQNPDTDGDGFTDGDEVKNKYDPTIRGDGQGSDALPERRAGQSQQVLDQFRPNPASDNITERTAALLYGNRPLDQLSTFSPPPEDVQRIVDAFPVQRSLPDIPITEISVKGSNTQADLVAYLSSADRARPTDLGDATSITNSIDAALRGNSSSLLALISRMSRYEAELKQIQVPATAVPHHRHLLAMVRFVQDRLGEIAGAASSDPVRAYIALRGLQEGFPPAASQLERLRADLDRLAAGAPAAAP